MYLDYLEEMLYTEVKSNPNSAFEISMDFHNIGNCGYITALIFDRDEDPLTNMCQQSVIVPITKDSYRKITKIQKQSTTSSKKLFNKDEASNERSYKLSSFATNTTNRQFLNNLPTPTNPSSLNFSTSFNNTKQQLLSTSTNQLPKIPFHNQMTEESFFSNKKGMMNYRFYQLIIIYSVYICALALLFIYIYSFFFKGTIFNNLEDYLNINLILVKMKLYIISTCVSISSACLISDNIMKDNYYNVTLSIETLKGLVSQNSTKFFE